MASLKINTAKFKDLCEDARLRYENDADIRKLFTYRHWLNCNIETDEIIAPEPKPVSLPTYEDFRTELSVAAMRMQQHGATKPQIEYLAKLAVASGNKTLLGVSTLTKREASELIDFLKNSKAA